MTLPTPTVRPGWRDSLAAAADLAALGIVVFLACLPVFTAGAALATGSVAVDGLCRRGALPSVRHLGRVARRALLPGAVATAAVLATAALMALDLRLVLAGTIPGGAPVTAALAVVAAALVALVATTIVRIGQTEGAGWRAALLWAGRLLRTRPALIPAALGVLACAGVIALLVPVLSLLLPAFILYALHALTRPRPARQDLGRR